MKFYFEIHEGETLVSCANDNNRLLWPEDGNWYGRLDECPYKAEAVKISEQI